jgi:hypothetical protein
MTATPASPSSTDLALLENRDYTVILARTATAYPSPPPGAGPRWAAAQTSILNLVHTCEALDPDGITLYVSCKGAGGGCLFHKYEQVTSANLMAVLTANIPPEEVQLEIVLPTALNDYLQRKAAGTTKANGEMLLVLADGEPGNRVAIARAIVQASQKLDRDEELGIGLVQLGQDPLAQGFFQSLDDDLHVAGAKYDVVHTKILEAISPHCLTDFLLEVLSD